jgi:hypothetical protein
MKTYLNRLLFINLVLIILVSACGNEDENPKPVIGEISPAQAASNTLLTLTGSDLRNIASIVFATGNIKAEFNPNFNTNQAILFRVPGEAIPGAQDIILTNKNGTKSKVPFNVLGFVNITTVSNYNFRADTEITLSGKNLADVTTVVFTNGATPVQIVSKTATTLTLKFPTTDLFETTLDITNAAGMSRTTQSFVAIDNAFQLFTDNYSPGYQDASWGSGGTISTSEFKSGTASVYKDYAAGNWHQLGFGWTQTPNDNYEYLSFWIKGGTEVLDLYISSSASPSGFASFDAFSRITVPADVWTYFKIPVATLKLWGNNNTTAWNQLGWRIQGPNGADQRFYLDDVIFIKK